MANHSISSWFHFIGRLKDPAGSEVLNSYKEALVMKLLRKDSIPGAIEILVQIYLFLIRKSDDSAMSRRSISTTLLSYLC